MTKSAELITAIQLQEILGYVNKEAITEKRVNEVADFIDAKLTLKDKKAVDYIYTKYPNSHGPRISPSKSLALSDYFCAEWIITGSCHMCIFSLRTCPKLSSFNHATQGCISNKSKYNIERVKKIKHLIETYGIEWFKKSLLLLKDM